MFLPVPWERAATRSLSLCMQCQVDPLGRLLPIIYKPRRNKGTMR
jgi:hypothetical protein